MLQTFDEKNRDILINISGELVHRDEARISPFDSVVQGGDAVWEGLRLYSGRIFKLYEHLDRLRSSAQALAFAQIPSHDKIVEQIKRTLAEGPAQSHLRKGDHLRVAVGIVQCEGDLLLGDITGRKFGKEIVDHLTMQENGAFLALEVEIHHAPVTALGLEFDRAGNARRDFIGARYFEGFEEAAHLDGLEP